MTSRASASASLESVGQLARPAWPGITASPIGAALVSLAALRGQVSSEEFEHTNQTKLIDIFASYLIDCCVLFSTSMVTIQ